CTEGAQFTKTGQKPLENQGGGGEIRTPEGLRPGGFQDRCLKPGSATPPVGTASQPALASGSAARVASGYQLAGGLPRAHACAHDEEPHRSRTPTSCCTTPMRRLVDEAERSPAHQPTVCEPAVPVERIVARSNDLAASETRPCATGA